jgi:flagellar L-ring protein precursor FlgH
MKRPYLLLLPVCAVLLPARSREPAESAIDRLIRESQAVQAASTPGSLWSPNAGLTDLAADLRPRRVNDLVTIVVRDRASAIARGTVRSNRASSARASINSIAGAPPGGSRLPRLLDLSGETKLEGEGETSRETVLSTALSARVTHVLPNGLLVVEGQKSIRVNSEQQTVTVRGVIRPFDVTPENTVLSDQLAELEVAVNGKGVVGDAIRRPNILYRILLGILPF